MKSKRIRSQLLASTLLAGAAALGAGALVAVAPTTAAAQDYTSGNLTGRVETDAGQPIAGATVTVRSAQGTVRTATTDAGGAFRVTALPVGGYTADVAAEGYPSLANQRVSVAPGGSTFTFTLSSGTVEELVVTGTRATPDFSRTDTGLTVDVQDLAERVPVQRSISSVTLLAPGVGVSDPSIQANGVRRSQSTVAVSGTSAAESVYYINGLNVTDQRNFLGYADLPFDFIQTVDVKTGGYAAEFGRGTGGVVNIVTRSGSNEFHGGVSAYWTPNFLRASRGLAYAPGGNNSVGQLVYNQVSKENSNEQTIWASGPILQDHIFFFALYNNRFRDAWGPAGFSNPVTQNGTQTRVTSNDPRWGAKLDFVLNPDHRLEVTVFSDAATIDNRQYNVRKDTLKVGPDPANPAAANPDGTLLPYFGKTGGVNQIYKYTGVLSENFTLSALYGKIQSDYLDYGPHIAQPGIIDYATTSSYVTIGRQAGPFNFQGEDVRETYRIDGDLYFDAFGEHHVRAGFDLEKLTSSAVSAYSGGGIYSALPASDCPDGAGPAGCIQIIDFRNTGTFTAEQSAWYVQDSWQVLPNLTLQLGLRGDIYDYKNAEGDSYISIDNQIAPRFGFTWDPFGRGEDRVYGSFGHYYLPIATNTSIRASSGETYTITHYQTQRDAAGNLVINNGFPVVGAQVGDVIYQSPPGAPDPRAVVEDGLKPMFEREIILGYEHTFDDSLFGGRLDGWRAGARLIYRNLESAIEDTAIGDAVYRYCQRTNQMGTCNPDGLTPTGFSGLFPYVLINPGDGARVFVDLQGDARTDAAGAPNPAYNPQTINLTAADLSLPEVDRSYKALELTFERPFDGVWGLQGSYTLSKSEGNYEGAVKSDTGQTDTSITQDFDHASNTLRSFGNLPNDRRHVLKVFGTWRPIERLTVGGLFTASSGRPYGCIGYVPPAVDPLAPQSGTPSGWYCPTGAATGQVTSASIRQQLIAAGAPTTVHASQPFGRGGRNLDWATQLDLNLALDILTAEDDGGQLQATLDIYNLFDSDTVTRVVEQGEVRTSQKGVPAPFYGRARNYQAPRTVRFGLRYRF